MPESIWDVRWPLVIALGLTGMPMALLSSLVGMRQRVENAAWWILYSAWLLVVLLGGDHAPFRSILYASAIAGVVHGLTQGALIHRYVANNPWYTEQLQKPANSLRIQFVAVGCGVGIGMGALVGGIAWALRRWVLG